MESCASTLRKKGGTNPLRLQDSVWVSVAMCCCRMEREGKGRGGKRDKAPLQQEHAGLYYMLFLVQVSCWGLPMGGGARQYLQPKYMGLDLLGERGEGRGRKGKRGWWVVWRRRGRRRIYCCTFYFHCFIRCCRFILRCGGSLVDSIMMNVLGWLRWVLAYPFIYLLLLPSIVLYLVWFRFVRLDLGFLFFCFFLFLLFRGIFP